MGTTAKGFDAPDSLAERVVTGLAKVSLALKSHAWHEAAPRGLTPTQAQILAMLRLKPSGMRLLEVAAGLAVTAATASDAVSSLVDKGLVKKAPAPEDARAVSITLTTTVRREADQSAGWPEFLLEAFETLSPSEQEVFLRGIIKIIHSLQEQGRIPVGKMCVTCKHFSPNVHADNERPHHCAFVDAAFGDRHLRLHCAEQQPADEPRRLRIWQVYAAGPTPNGQSSGTTKTKEPSK